MAVEHFIGIRTSTSPLRLFKSTSQSLSYVYEQPEQIVRTPVISGSSIEISAYFKRSAEVLLRNSKIYVFRPKNVIYYTHQGTVTIGGNDYFQYHSMSYPNDFDADGGYGLMVSASSQLWQIQPKNAAGINAGATFPRQYWPLNENGGPSIRGYNRAGTSVPRYWGSYAEDGTYLPLQITYPVMSIPQVMRKTPTGALDGRFVVGVLPQFSPEAL